MVSGDSCVCRQVCHSQWNALQQCTKTKRKPVSILLFVPVSRRLDTDVAMGRAGGLKTVLTLSGVSTLQDAQAAAAAGTGADVIVSALANLAGL